MGAYGRKNDCSCSLRMWNRGIQRRFFRVKTLKALFMLSRVPLDLLKCILSGAINFVSVRSSYESSSFSEITRASVLFSRNLRCNLNENFLIPLSITFLNPKILGLLFPTKNSLTWGMKCENRR